MCYERGIIRIAYYDTGDTLSTTVGMESVGYNELSAPGKPVFDHLVRIEKTWKLQQHKGWTRYIFLRHPVSGQASFAQRRSC